MFQNSVALEKRTLWTFYHRKGWLCLKSQLNLEIQSKVQCAPLWVISMLQHNNNILDLIKSTTNRSIKARKTHFITVSLTKYKNKLKLQTIAQFIVPRLCFPKVLKSLHFSLINWSFTKQILNTPLMLSKLVPRPIYPLLEYLLTIDPDWKEALCFRSHVIQLGLNDKNPLISTLLHNNKNKRKISEKWVIQERTNAQSSWT